MEDGEQPLKEVLSRLTSSQQTLKPQASTSIAQMQLQCDMQPSCTYFGLSPAPYMCRDTSWHEAVPAGKSNSVVGVKASLVLQEASSSNLVIAVNYEAPCPPPFVLRHEKFPGCQLAQVVSMCGDDSTCQSLTVTPIFEDRGLAWIATSCAGKQNPIRRYLIRCAPVVPAARRRTSSLTAERLTLHPGLTKAFA